MVLVCGCSGAPQPPTAPAASAVSPLPSIEGSWGGTAVVQLPPGQSSATIRGYSGTVPVTLDFVSRSSPGEFDVRLRVDGWVGVTGDLSATLRNDGLVLSGNDNRRRDSFCSTPQNLIVRESMFTVGRGSIMGSSRLSFTFNSGPSCYSSSIEVELSPVTLQRTPS